MAVMTVDIDITPIEQARQAFVTAVTSGGNGAAEYATWQAAHQTAADALAKAQTDESERYRLASQTYGELLRDQRNLTYLATRVGQQLGTPAEPYTYTADEHAQRVSDWCTRASEYAGQQITELDAQLDEPPGPRLVVAATPIPTEPPVYWIAVEQLGQGAA